MHQAIEASTFEVTEVPIKYEGLVNTEDYKFIVNTKTCEVISCMTKDYRLVSNQEVIDKSLPHIEKQSLRETAFPGIFLLIPSPDFFPFWRRDVSWPTSE